MKIDDAWCKLDECIDTIAQNEMKNKRYVCKIYLADGKELEAISVEPTCNACGYGYRIVDRLGRVMFYKTDEVINIIPTKEEIKG